MTRTRSPLSLLLLTPHRLHLARLLPACSLCLRRTPPTPAPPPSPAPSAPAPPAPTPSSLTRLRRRRSSSSATKARTTCSAFPIRSLRRSSRRSSTTSSSRLRTRFFLSRGLSRMRGGPSSTRTLGGGSSRRSRMTSHTFASR
ncbi:hypothetical protein AAT19DRAFT_13576 [Rhodotorula toruloides]|uniref:Uncharacterized protein n=1 Tax=Rhodotorula toruloides TaxID=5286 RepID=A0A2T0ABX9_RHOTO|nr:hypothetical protein AAT19DRAFT_13576 [Rhodotorula toruloides]